MRNLIKSLIFLFAIILAGNSSSFALTIEEQPVGDVNYMRIETSTNSQPNVVNVFDKSDNKFTFKERLIVKKFSKSEYFKQGQPEKQEEKQGNPKSQIVAFILAFFLGGLGIHRFYLGYTGIGILMLLTGGVCGILALIDIIRILIGDLKPADGSDYDPKF